MLHLFIEQWQIICQCIKKKVVSWTKILFNNINNFLPIKMFVSLTKITFTFWAILFFLYFIFIKISTVFKLGCYNNFTDQYKYRRTWVLQVYNQPSVPFKMLHIHAGDIVRGHWKVFQNGCKLSSKLTLKMWNFIMLTPLLPFLHFMSASSSSSTASSMWSAETWGVGETKTQVSSLQHCVHPWQLLFQANVISHFVKVWGSSEAPLWNWIEIWFYCWKEIRLEIW